MRKKRDDLVHLFDEEKSDSYFFPFFCIYINSECDLKSVAINDTTASGFFHEYIHFLQNTTTTYGMVATSTILNKIKDIYGVKTEYQRMGINDLSIPVIESEVEATRCNLELLNSSLAYTETSIVDLSSLVIEESESNIVKGCPLKSYFAVFKNGYRVQFGAHAIMEGLADVLQRVVFHGQRSEELIPYDLAYSIWCKYVSREETNLAAFITLLEFSLMFYNPAEIYIKSLKFISSKELRITENFYEDLDRCWKAGNKNGSILLDDAFEEVKNDILGSLGSPVFEIYRKWLIECFEKGVHARKKNRSLFSSLLSLDLRNDNCKNFFWTKAFKTTGFPPTTNCEGEIACLNAEDAFFATSFLAGLAIRPVYDCLSDGICECSLKEQCRHYKVKSMSDNCNCAPWMNDSDEHVCFFAAVWKCFGLSDFSITRHVM